MVSRQGEHWLALKCFYHPDDCSIGGEHHQLPVQAELDPRPVAASLNLVLECGERSLVKTSHIVKFNLFTLNSYGKNESLRIKTGNWTTLKQKHFKTRLLLIGLFSEPDTA